MAKTPDDVCDPNATTEFEVSKEGVKIQSKRMSELIAILSLVLLGVSSSFTYQLSRQIDAMQMTMRAEGAERQQRVRELTAALRELACVSGASPTERAHCAALSRIQ